MKPALALLMLLLVTHLAFGEDVKVREQAEHLLERANAVSSSPHLPNLERIDTFRVFEDGAVKEGSFTRVVVQGTGRRDEYTYEISIASFEPVEHHLSGSRLDLMASLGGSRCWS